MLALVVAALVVLVVWFLRGVLAEVLTVSALVTLVAQLV